MADPSSRVSLLKSLNLTLRFLVELGLLGALGFWGAHTGRTALIRTALAVGAPVTTVLLWGLLISPKAPAGLSPLVRLTLSLPVFGVATIALNGAHAPRAAMIFGTIATLNTLVLIIIEIKDSVSGARHRVR